MSRRGSKIPFAATVATLLLAASAQASGPTWTVLGSNPSSATSKCKDVACLNREVTTLTRTVRSQEKRVLAATREVATLTRCLSEVPVNQYGNATSGYVWDPGDGTPTVPTTALDAVPSGSPVGAWLLADNCNTKRSAIRRSQVSRSSTSMTPFMEPFARIAR